MGSISQIQLPNNTKYNLNVPFIVGTGTVAGTWLGTLDGLTEYYDGLMILYKPAIKGASTTTLNINDLGAKTCYINNTTKVTTNFPANQPILLTYSASQNSGCWMCVDNYYASYSAMSVSELTTGTATTSRVVRADHMKQGIEEIIEDNISTKMDKTNPIGSGSFSLNRSANTTIGTNSFAEGLNTTASGMYSHAEGYVTTASGKDSHAEGNGTTASGLYAHAEGSYTTASRPCSHAEGNGTTASGNSSHAEGNYTTASGVYSHAEGDHTIAAGSPQHVSGRYNIADNDNTYAEIVGNGTTDTRSNARTLDWQGNEVLSGTIEATGFGTVLDREVDRGGVQLTQAEYDALVSAGTVDADTTYFITDKNNPNAVTASQVMYDNSGSELDSTNVQEAINELNSLLYTRTVTISQAALPITSSYVTSGIVVCYKKGSTLVIKAGGLKFSTFTGRITIGTAPVGYRPEFESTGMFDGTAVSFGIRASGELWVDAGASGKQLWGMITTILS